MKNLKYIFLVAFLSLYLSVDAFNVLVTFADKPAKNAKVYNEQQEVIARTDSEGYVTLDDATTYVAVRSNGIIAPFQVNPGVDRLTIVPPAKKLAKLINKDASVENCELYLKYYTGEKHTELVAETLERKVYEDAYFKAIKEFDFMALQGYLEKYPEGEFVAKANKTMEIVSWQVARFQNTEDSYSDFVARYPASDASKVAKEKMAELK